MKRAILCLLLISIAAGGFAARINLKDPIKLADDQTLRAVYYFPHWWDPWKSDDAAVTADLKKMKEIGLNTICVDHEVSQAIDRDWYWLDREYKLATAEKMSILPWLQLQCVDRSALMKFSRLELKPAVNQDKQVEDDFANFRDGEFKRALTHYINVYLDRYGNDPALLRIKDKGKLKPMIGIVVEAGWRNGSGLPLSFDDDTNAYFRKWMKASYHDLAQLNAKWGTNYENFDEIDPCDKTIFDYSFADKANMPMAIREHTHFRARMVSDMLSSVASDVLKKHKDVLFVAEVAYPFISDDPNASAYHWNSANEYKAVDFADMIVIRTLGGTSTGQFAKENELIMLNGKRLILSYRLFDDSTSSKAVSLALDCAVSCNGLAYYSWNETKDTSSAIYDKPEKQSLVQLLTTTYDTLYNVDKRHAVVIPVSQPAVSPVEPPAPKAENSAEPPAAAPAPEPNPAEAPVASPVEPPVANPVEPPIVNPVEPMPVEPPAAPAQTAPAEAPQPEPIAPQPAAQ